MSKAPPLRFLALVIGGWVAARAALLAPEVWREEPQPVLAEKLEPAPQTTFAVAAAAAFDTTHAPRVAQQSAPPSAIIPAFVSRAPVEVIAPQMALVAVPAAVPQDQGRTSIPSSSFLTPGPTIAPTSRWSVSAWALARRGGDGNALVPGGILGGSQAGVRVTYALRPSLRLSGRLSSPLGSTDGSEAAFGVEWQPLATVPLRFLAERRQEIGHESRSAFALLAHGGVSDQRLIGPVRVDAYAQAGIVGTRSRDAFVDGAVRLGMPVGDGVDIGAGIWGAAQPDAARFDVGPSASYRLPGLARSVRVTADWRVRVAGDARPGSGPALTLSTDF